MDYIMPSVLIDGKTYYPTGLQWLLAFAVAGCKWAEDALEDYRTNVYPKLWIGENI